MIMDDERRGSRNVKNADCGSGGINISDNHSGPDICS